MKEYLLKDLFEPPISGVWGNELTEGQKGIKVLRTTNFTNDGRINYDEVVERDIDLKDDRKILRKHDIIIEKSGGGPEQPVGRVVFLNKETDLENEVYVCNNFTAILRPRQGFNKKYLFYILMNLYNRGVVLKFQNKTTGISNLKLKDYLKTTKVNIPNIQTQQKIADVLDKAQFLIDKRKEQIKECDRLIESLFYDMFGDPATNPKGWSCRSFKSVARIATISADMDEIGEDDLYVGLEHIEKDTGKILEYVRAKDVDLKSDKFKFNEGMILYGKLRPYLNKVALIKQSGVCSTDILPILPNNDFINIYYLLYYMRDRYFVNSMTQRAIGANLPRVNKRVINSFRIMLPPLELQNEFARKVEKIEHQKQLLEKSLSLMEDNFNSLMQKAFRGELFS